MKMQWLLAAVALLRACAPEPTFAQSVGRVERLRTDLRAPARDLLLVLTEGLDARIEMDVRYDGGMFDASDWQAVLWYGPSDASPVVGQSVTNSVARRGLVAWDVPSAVVATNGTFRLQVVANRGGRLEEWGRGTLRLRDNPAADFVPFEWQALPWATVAQLEALTPGDIGAATAAQGALADTALQSEADAIALEAIGNLTPASIGAATSAQGANADTAHGWGDHATAGYLTTEADTLPTVLDRGSDAGGRSISGLGTVTTTNLVASGSATVGTRAVGSTVGESSFAQGGLTTASGPSSFASGNLTTASGSSSFATGDLTTASGARSTATGSSTIASGSDSTAMGNTTTASGASSTASGLMTIASGDYSEASGFNATSSHVGSFAWQGTAGAGGESVYTSKGPGTWAINPEGGTAGAYIGADSIADLLAAKASTNHVTQIASTSTLGHVRVDGTTVTIDGDGILSAAGGGIDYPTLYAVGNTSTNLTVNPNTSLWWSLTTGGAVTNSVTAWADNTVAGPQLLVDVTRTGDHHFELGSGFVVSGGARTLPLTATSNAVDRIMFKWYGEPTEAWVLENILYDVR